MSLIAGTGYKNCLEDELLMAFFLIFFEGLSSNNYNNNINNNNNNHEAGQFTLGQSGVSSVRQAANKGARQDA